MMRITLPQVKDCSDCGACCTGQAALPIHLVGEHFRLRPVKRLLPELAAELMAAAKRFQRDGFPPDDSACICYDTETKRCKHYEHRPELCRDGVKPDDDACHRSRRLLGIEGTARFTLKQGRLTAGGR